MEAQPRHPTLRHTLVTTGVDAAVGVEGVGVHGDVIGMCMREGEFLPPGWTDWYGRRLDDSDSRDRRGSTRTLPSYQLRTCSNR